ncbi:MAG TPA: hypothetical protein VHO84_13645, partial [Syntrophorhabdaceae bacterium]|nr:hypothetical protein [Syntrophorhabdaceae bacterium]
IQEELRESPAVPSELPQKVKGKERIRFLHDLYLQSRFVFPFYYPIHALSKIRLMRKELLFKIGRVNESK